MALGLEQSLKIIVSAVDQASGTLDGIRKSVQNLHGDASDASAQLSSIGKATQEVGRDLTRYVTLPVMAGFGLATKEAMDFEEQIAVLSIAAKDSGADMDTLSKAAITMGNDTRLVGVDAAESAAMMTEFAKSGLTVQQMFGDLEAYLAGTAELMGTLRAAIDLAAASELSLAEASDVIATTMVTYKLEAEDALEIANAYVKAADASKASVSSLAQSVTTAGTVMSGYNISLDDTLLMLAMLADRGIEGAEAGTALRSMYNNMMRDTDATTEALGKLGVSLYDQQGNLRSAVEIFEDLNQAVVDITDQQRITAFQDIFGFYGAKAGIPLVEGGAKAFDTMSKKIDNAATVSEVAGVRSETFAQAVENLKGVVETFMIAAGTPFIEDFLRPAVEHATELISKLSEMNPETLNLALRLALIAAMAGPALIALGSLARAVASLVTLYQMLAGAQVAAGVAGGGAGVGAAGAGLGAVSGLGAAATLGVAGAGLYLGSNPEIVKGWQDKLREMLGMSALEPGASWGERASSAWDWARGLVGAGEEGAQSPDVLAAMAAGEPIENARIFYEEGGVNSAEAFASEFEAQMTQYDWLFEQIGVGAADKVKTGLMTATEDFGSDFLARLAEQLAPELVPYVVGSLAAQKATAGGRE